MKKQTIISFMLAIFASSLLAQPRVWNLEKMAKAKLENSASVEKIKKEADKILSKTIASVVDKTKPAPSGDKHDYISCGPYWWPDPKNPTGPYIRRDGEQNKAVLTPDKVNLSVMSKGIIYLAAAYYLSDEEKYAAKAIENLRIWFLNPKTKMNPNMNFGQTIYGHLGGKGRGAGMIETYIFVQMLDAVEILKKSPKFTKADQDGLLKWFTEYLDWMRTSEVGNQEYEAKNNHGTAFDVQATRVALFLGKEDIARKYIANFPTRRLFSQIEPDGKQPAELVRTKALHYSMFNLTHILDMCLIAKTLNIDLYNLKSDDGRSISKALEFMAQFAGKPKSEFPYKQISDWDGAQKRLILQLYRADKLTEKNDFKNYYSENLPKFSESLILYNQ
jgi:hypothetical protein